MPPDHNPYDVPVVAHLDGHAAHRWRRLATRHGERDLPGRVDALNLVPHGGQRPEAEREQQDERGQAHGQLGRRHPVVSTPHCSARSTTAVSAAWMVGEVSTFGSTPAKATAASVPTAYSTVVIPSSRRLR